jgi:hypothetical protein
MVDKKNKYRKNKEEMTPIEKQQNKQLIIFFMIMLIILGGTIMIYIHLQQESRFNYAGVEFQKGKEGDFTFYHGRFPINYLGQTLKIFNLYLRIDPRKNNIPINTNLSLSKEIIITFEPGLEKCYNAIVGQSTLAQFVTSFPWVEKVSGAVSNKTYAEENKIEFADCSSATKNRTIIFSRISLESSIEKEEENCYVMNVADCKYLEITERYILGLIAQINEKKI